MNRGQRSAVSGQESSKPGVLGRLVFCLLPLALLGTGCATDGSFPSLGGPDRPTGAPCHVVAAWIPEVRLTPDVVHGGEKFPSLGGRVYLFGEEVKYPLVSEGSISIELYDTTGGKTPVPLETWHIDKDTLKRLEKRDAVGWGYSLALPWRSYKPEIKQVELRLRFEPLKGFPLYADSAPVTFKNDMQITTKAAERVVKPQGQDIQQTKAN